MNHAFRSGFYSLLKKKKNEDGENMKNHFVCFWLIIYGYRSGLISRKEFVDYWKGVQSLETDKIKLKEVK